MQGIVAGSGHATFELKGCMVRQLQIFVRANPELFLNIHVDDALCFDESQTRAEALINVIHAGRALRHVFTEDLQFPLAEDKAVAFSSSRKLLRNLQSRTVLLGKPAGAPVALGADLTPGLTHRGPRRFASRSMAVGRLRKMKRRWRSSGG